VKVQVFNAPIRLLAQTCLQEPATHNSPSRTRTTTRTRKLSPAS